MVAITAVAGTVFWPQKHAAESDPAPAAIAAKLLEGAFNHDAFLFVQVLGPMAVIALPSASAALCV